MKQKAIAKSTVTRGNKDSSPAIGANSSKDSGSSSDYLIVKALAQGWSRFFILDSNEKSG